MPALPHEWVRSKTHNGCCFVLHAGEGGGGGGAGCRAGSGQGQLSKTAEAKLFPLVGLVQDPEMWGSGKWEVKFGIHRLEEPVPWLTFLALRQGQGDARLQG